MNLLADPFIRLIRRTPLLKRGAGICIALALIAAVAEIAVALSLIPVIETLGVDAGAKVSKFAGQISQLRGSLYLRLLPGYAR